MAVNNQSVQLYLHHLPANVSVSGFQTQQVLNATSLWDGLFLTPNLRYTLSNFTLYPSLASSLTSSGAGSISLWATVTGANPGTVNATIYEANGAGQVAVVTSSVVVTNSTSPNIPYEITFNFNINHTFTQSSALILSLKAARVSQLYVYYDSAAYPSAILLPVLNVPRISLVETFDWALNPQKRFSLNWTASQRVVFNSIHVADPFGAYHVANATVSITGPGSSQVYSGLANSLTTNPGDPERIFGLNWPYAQNTPPGNYTVSVMAYDMSGNQALGSAGMTLYNTNSPPGQPPGQPSNPYQQYIFIAIGLAGLGALLLGLLLYRRRRAKCPKCGARFGGKLDKCPSCGNLVHG